MADLLFGGHPMRATPYPKYTRFVFTIVCNHLYSFDLLFSSHVDFETPFWIRLQF